MFKSATIKLTAWYLTLIMGLSFAFSLVLYNVSANSLDVGLEHQRITIRQQFQQYFALSPTQLDLERLRDSELSVAQQRLIANLILVNVGVLAIGGAASFWMARRTLRPIEQAMEAQKRFTADASHELRTPLTAMQTEIEVALRDKTLSNDDARELLQSNLEEVGKLQALSNGLLTLASQDKDHFAPTPVSSSDIVAEAVKRASGAATRKTIQIENKTAEASIVGDRDSLVQLLSILLDNAIKYSPKRTTITITSQRKGSHELLSIADQGYGIKASDLPHIFERLYRADSARSKGHVEGYGLGLSIAKKIVQLHKGAIDVASSEGHGSTFTIRLPLESPKDNQSSSK